MSNNNFASWRSNHYDIMSLSALVKISSVNNLSDARYAAGMGVELMGFDLDKNSHNFLDPPKFESITGWISGVKIVAEVTSISVEELAVLQKDYHFDYLQISDVERSQLASLEIPLIIKIDRSDTDYIDHVIQSYADQVSWFLLELKQELSPQLLAWCAEKAAEVPIILGGHAHANNVLELLEAGFAGIAITGGVEIKPGFGNFDEIADVLELLEIDD